jgi:eukaryotic-like serine/threonine-protein kinase
MSKVFTITEGLENMGAIRTGGQGSVYKGRRMGPIISAVKILPTPIYSEDEKDKNFRSFNNEVSKLKKVNELPNPNVVKILNSGLTESGSFPFIEMEFIEGPDLEELLADPHDPVFTIKEVLKVADHLANALAHCHLVGVKHGDVKSNNVKYNVHSGNYVLLDFGLAIMSDEQRRTSIRHAGAIEFMAPEQNTGAMYFQTDIYSYGIILYELLAGQVPFPLHDSGETSRNAVMIAHMEQDVPDLMEKRRANIPKGWAKEKRTQEMRVPQWLLQLISTCLEKDPEKRYATGMALQEALFAGSLSTDQVAEIERLPETVETKEEKATIPVAAPIPDEQGITRVATPIFVLMIVAIACSLCAAAYFYTQRKTGPAPETVIPKDSVAKPATDTTTPARQVSQSTYQQRSQEADSATQKAIKDDIKQERQKAEDQQNKDSANNKPPQDTTSHGGTEQQ